MLSKTFAALILAASPALSTVFITSPTALSTFSGNQPANISWQDDGSAPSLAQFGNAEVSIYVGNAIQQTSLQTIVSSVNVATTASIQFTPNPNIGPNGNQYFIRFQSLAFNDPKNPQFPALSFSAKFTMNGMTGSFNSSVLAEIAGQSTAPLAGATSPAAGQAAPNTASASQALATVSRSSLPSGTPSSASGATSPSSSTGAALHSKAGWTGIILSALIGVAAF